MSQVISNFWYIIPALPKYPTTYHQDPWSISANVNNFLGFFPTHYFTNSSRYIKKSGFAMQYFGLVILVQSRRRVPKVQVP